MANVKVIILYAILSSVVTFSIVTQMGINRLQFLEELSLKQFSVGYLASCSEFKNNKKLCLEKSIKSQKHYIDIYNSIENYKQ